MKTRTGLTDGNATGDMHSIEADLPDWDSGTEPARYVNLALTANNAGDDFAVVYILSGAKHGAAGLSADVISA